MFKFTVAMVFLAVAFLHGCGGSGDPHYVYQIDENTTRAEVEELLGDPVEVEETDEGRVYKYTYAYSIDAKEMDNPKLDYLAGAGLAFLIVYPVAMISDVSGVRDETKTETVFVTYGPDGRVTRAETENQRSWRLVAEQREQERRELEELALSGDPEAQYQMGLRTESDEGARRKWLVLAANQGHAASMYSLGKLSETESIGQWRWYCEAAVRGNAEAQYELGRGYHKGEGPRGTDLSKALFWFSLSDSGGYRHGQYWCYDDPNLNPSRWECDTSTDSLITEIRSQLTEEDIAEVERLLATWEPNPADCYEPDGAQAGN